MVNSSKRLQRSNAEFGLLTAVSLGIAPETGATHQLQAAGQMLRDSVFVQHQTSNHGLRMMRNTTADWPLWNELELGLHEMAIVRTY